MVKEKALKEVDRIAERLFKLSDDIWDHPETAFGEKVSAALQIEVLKELGFEVTENLCGIRTAFSGSFGSGGPVIGLLGEFDALSGLSQQADCTMRCALVEGGAGHGCGHNILGTASIGAAAAVKKYLEETGTRGTVIYFGCPAEEGGSGKAFMARDGAFDCLDCAITWHPGDCNMVMRGSFLANYQIDYKFTGRAAHAAGAPHMGRSALDACELMNVGVQFLREHIIPEARIHYAITDTGGYSPNVVQPVAEVLYLIRAPRNDQVRDMYERVNDIARGAALMTGTSVDIKFIKACSNVVPNEVLGLLMQENMEKTGVPHYTDEDRKYAEDIASTIEGNRNTLNGYLLNMSKEDSAGLKPLGDRSLYDFILPFPAGESVIAGSSDVGDVSWVCPTAQICGCTMAAGTPGHSWQLVSQGKSSIAHKGLLFASRVMAGTVIDLFEDQEIIERARAEHIERVGPGPFVSPIPADVVPTVLGKK